MKTPPPRLGRWQSSHLATASTRCLPRASAAESAGIATGSAATSYLRPMCRLLATYAAAPHTTTSTTTDARAMPSHFSSFIVMPP